MLDFRDEFVIEGIGVTWLLWVQLIVMILLIIVLFCGFSIFALDDRCSNNPTSIGAEYSSQSCHKDPLVNNSSSKVERNQRFEGRAETSASKEIIEDEIEEREESPANDIALVRLFRHRGHPCDYFGLAKQAILKCFGLGYTSESFHRSKHRKED